MIVDCDVHQEIDREETIWEYLSPGWREFVKGPLPAEPPLSISPSIPFRNPHGFFREDLTIPEGARVGSDPELVKEELLDRYEIDNAVLTGETSLYVGGISNPYFAQELCRAFNDHMLERWLSTDRRFLGTIAVPIQTPEAAVLEINRLKDEDRVIQVMLCANALGHPFGHPIFDPIHRAAAEAGLPIGIHSFGEGAGYPPGETLAAGKPSFYTEFHTGAIQGMMTHLVSFILHGVFERYPGLKVAFLEGGIEWVPGLLLRLDANYQGLRREVPWCRKPPSEYVREHIYFSTQPLDVPSASHPFWGTVSAAGLEGNLMFATDYPHWDADSPRQTLSCIPAEFRERVQWQNAAELYELSADRAHAA
ncbi:MAG: amidohydrolase [Actinobacteria bacterium]|nr:amidohydrolase [Actinomycetota bacterium]